MKGLISVDGQFFRTPDGEVWTKTMYGYFFWLRYLNVFESIDVISRLEDVTYDKVKGYLKSSGTNVYFKKLPMAIGTLAYLKQWTKFTKMAKESLEDVECAVIRLPSISGMFIEKQVNKLGIPYAIEVVVDPENAYMANRMACYFITQKLKNSVVKANGVSYVTQYALQKKYPSRKHGETEEYFESYYSSILLKKSYFSAPRDYLAHGPHYKIIHVANNMNNYIKGHKETLEIIKKLVEKGVDVTLEFVGDGTKRDEFSEYADKLGISERVTFTGLLSSPEEVRKKLLEADIFLFPTKAEGLPRVIIEAMAVGLPCISTPVNGIPELLSNENMFLPSDIDGFSNRIVELVRKPQMLNEMSAFNIKKAGEYEESVLTERRNEFYTKLITLAKMRKCIQSKN